MYSSQVSNSSISLISSMISVVVVEVVNVVVDVELLDEMVDGTVDEASVETEVVLMDDEVTRYVSVVDELVNSSNISLLVGEVLVGMGDVILDDVQS